MQAELTKLQMHNSVSRKHELHATIMIVHVYDKSR